MKGILQRNELVETLAALKLISFEPTEGNIAVILKIFTIPTNTDLFDLIYLLSISKCMLSDIQK